MRFLALLPLLGMVSALPQGFELFGMDLSNFNISEIDFKAFDWQAIPDMMSTLSCPANEKNSAEINKTLGCKDIGFVMARGSTEPGNMVNTLIPLFFSTRINAH
jgi:hypothetical protein